MGFKDPWHRMQMRVTSVSQKSYLTLLLEEIWLTLCSTKYCPQAQYL